MLTRTDRKINFRYEQPWDKKPNCIQCRQQTTNSKKAEIKNISAAFITQNNAGNLREGYFLILAE